MRRYDYKIGAFVIENSNENFSAYSIVDGKVLSYDLQESIKYDNRDTDFAPVS